MLRDGGSARANRTKAASIEQFAAAVLKMADQLGHKQFRLHATSFGSLIALRAMLDYPDRIVAASLHCGFADCRLTLFERMLVSLGLRSRRTLGALRSAVRLQMANHRQWFPPFDGSRWDFYFDNIAATPVADVAQRALWAHALTLDSELDRLLTPVLLLNCEGDGRVSSAAQANLAERLPRCRTESLDNCGRLPHVTHPHRLVKSLKAFWEQTP